MLFPVSPQSSKLLSIVKNSVGGPGISDFWFEMPTSAFRILAGGGICGCVKGSCNRINQPTAQLTPASVLLQLTSCRLSFIAICDDISC